MAKVATNGLPWLSNPSTGYDLFTKPAAHFTPPPATDEPVTPKRLIATRASEIYVGRGNEVRCADLQDLKARHPDIKVEAEGAKKIGHREYKALNLPELDFEVKQLEISPDDLYLAIVGEREVAMCVLPGQGFLKRDAARPAVPYYHRVGKGYHNADTGERIVRALWHPLGAEGASLIVLTADGYIRTYDFTIGNEISFEIPDQTLDLYVLNGKKRHTGGFAADTDEMEPASCCFGSGEQGWRPFTLYILMRSGDIYALSPLVPSRWLPPSGYIHALSLDITAEMEADSDDTRPEDKIVARHQTKWINDVLNQQQNLLDARNSFLSPRGHIPTCFTRPQVVGPSPELQGPFLFEPAPPELNIDDFPAGCDIFHLEAGPVGVIGIIYSHGKLDLCIEPEPITAKWVNKKGKKSEADKPDQLPVIAHFDTKDLQINAGNQSQYTNWPTFTKDPQSTQLWFVNHIGGVTIFSMKPWLSKLASGLEDEESDADLFQLLASCPKTQLQTVIDSSRNPIDGCTVVYEAYIGYILIAGHAAGLSSVEFDEPLAAEAFLPEDIFDSSFTLQAPQRLTGDVLATPRAPRLTPPDLTPKPQQQQPQRALSPAPKLSILQPPYAPSPEFTQQSQLPQLLRGMKDAKKPFQFSSATLTSFKQARDQLKTEFDALMSGAQEMYDRAAAQRLEYNKQLEALHSISSRVAVLKNKNVTARIEAFIERQQKMQQRADALLRKLITESVIGLSDAEKKYQKEINGMMERVAGDATNALGDRIFKVTDLVNDLIPLAHESLKGQEEIEDAVPKEVREGKIKALREMLEKEGGLVAGARKRLEALEIECERSAMA